MAYTGIDKEIYDSGTHFRPLQEYTQQQWTPPAIMGQNTNAGIVNTQAAGSYMGYPSYEAWLLAQGGGGGGGNDSGDNINRGGINQNLGPTNITDYEAEAYGVGPTWAGSWAKAKDLYSQLPTPGNILKKIITTGTDKYNDWKTQQEEEEAERQAITRDRINQKIINTGIYKKTYIPPGADRHPDGPTDRFGGKGHPDAPTSPPDQGGWHPGVGNGGNQGSSGGAPTGVGNPMGYKAEGGRIGLSNGMTPFMAWVKDQYGVNVGDIKDWNFYSGLANEWKRLEGKKHGGLIGYFDGGIARLL